MYSGHYKSKYIYFLRQVNDFDIACNDEYIAKSIIVAIKSRISVDIKYLGLVAWFNDVDILHTKEYINIHGSTYINKILEDHKTWMQLRYCHTLLIPMKVEISYNCDLESKIPPAIDKQHYHLQRQYKLNYIQAVG